MRPPTASRVPAAAAALLSALNSIHGVTLLDGPTPMTPRADAIVVGAAGDASFIVDLAFQPGLGLAYLETIDIICSLWSVSGSQGMRQRRERCGELLEAVAAILQADPSLGGSCDLATMGSTVEWLQQSNETGAMCSVGFSVRVKTNI